MRPSADNNYPEQHKTNWKIIAGLWPYLTEFRGRVILAVGMLVLAKVATVATPVALKYIIDYLDHNRGVEMLLWAPLLLVCAYGALRFGSTLFSELRDAIFARVAERFGALVMRNTSVHTPLTESQHAIATTCNQSHIMGSHQHRHANTVKLFKQTQNAFRQRLIQVPRWLVSK